MNACCMKQAQFVEEWGVKNRVSMAGRIRPVTTNNERSALRRGTATGANTFL